MKNGGNSVKTLYNSQPAYSSPRQQLQALPVQPTPSAQDLPLKDWQQDANNGTNTEDE